MFVNMKIILKLLIIAFSILTIYSLLTLIIRYDKNNHKLLKYKNYQNNLNIMKYKKLYIQSKLEKLKTILNCKNIDYNFERIQHGDFWILKNYVRANHGNLNCYETITYTTHGDYTFLDNLPILIKRWQAPISIALHAAGYDFDKTLSSIQFLFNCLPESKLIRDYITFHIYFHNKHMPRYIPQKQEKFVHTGYNCNLPPPYINVNASLMYKTTNNLLYPINVGRNIARKAALSYLVLTSDIELYPNPGFVNDFLDMIVRNSSILKGNKPRVFPLAVFEIKKNNSLPQEKTELQKMLKNGSAISFHKNLCYECHAVTNLTQWIAAKQTMELDVFSVGKRIGMQKYWEPFYVGTNADPTFDERVNWEGQKNKIIQGYVLCLLDYEFHVLNNAFLVHNPGIKFLSSLKPRQKHIADTNKLIRTIIEPELKILYGQKEGCIW